MEEYKLYLNAFPCGVLQISPKQDKIRLGGKLLQNHSTPVVIRE